MGEGARESRPDLAKTMDSEENTSEPQEIRREIAETREELGETVEALAHKADVKARTKRKVAEKQEEAKAKIGVARDRVSQVTPEQAKQTATQVAVGARERPGLSIGVAALVGAVLVGWLIARR